MGRLGLGLCLLALAGCPTTGAIVVGPPAATTQRDTGYRPPPQVDTRPVWEQYPNDAGWQAPTWQ
ncbi:MAG: hypothetical protein JRE40_12580 [Deltaproteobacteria bacterium]|nr:hypothetical protein [Deltaproteobacteria bacterium]